MTSIPETVDEIIHLAIFDVALRAAKLELIILAPWLKLPVISQLFNFVLDQLAGLLYKNVALYAHFEVIDFQTDGQKSAYARAEAQLRLAHLSGDPHVLEDATAEFKSTLRNLVHFDPLELH